MKQDPKEHLREQIAVLTPAQRALFEQRLRRPGAQAVAPRIERESDRARAPLSFAQQRLWFLDQLEPGRPFYNMALAFRLRGPLRTDALRRALEALIARHETLRTTFSMVDDRPLQSIGPEGPPTLTVSERFDLAEADRDRLAAEWVAVEAGRPFDLARGPLLRAALLRFGEADHVLLLGMHHIISDGWSLGIFTEELARYYEEFAVGRPADLPALPIQYSDFARWQRRCLTGSVLDEQLAYWRRQLADLSALDLPTDRPRPRQQTFRGGRYETVFPSAVTKALRKLAQSEGATLYMALLTAFHVLLSRYTGQEDIVVGSPIAGRNRSELEGLIGFFVNALVMRTDLSGDPTFRELLRRVREVALGAYAHSDLPFEKLVEELQPQRDLGQNPLFQVTFALHNAPDRDLNLPGIALTRLRVESGATRFDLELHLSEREDGLHGSFVFSSDLFDASTVERMASHFRTLLEGIAADPDSRIARLPLLAESERRQLLEGWNQTDAHRPRGATVHGLFEEQAERAPGAVAVAFGRESLTYGELNDRSNRLARYLSQRGVGPDVLVGLFVERSIEMVVGMLAILKAGGAYVPLDPNYPDERLAFMLQDASPALVVTQSGLAHRLPAGVGDGVVCVDRAWPTAALIETGRTAMTEPSESPAYVLYTSGSSGKPKGVSVPHGAVVNLLVSMADLLGLGSDDRLLAVTTLSFDIAALEIYLPLAVGARIVLASREVASSGVGLVEALGESGATLMQATPVTWRMAIEAGWQGKSSFQILCGGEALSRDLANELTARSNSVWNLYGPTETTIWSTAFRVSDGNGPVPIGRPLANTKIYLLDATRRTVPVGVPGEIYIGGAGVARGYLNRPELSAEKFVADPFSGEPGARLYRTGDVGRYRPDGNIEYVGRVDDQIKLRGYRIEPGEIESALARHPDIATCAVAARQEPSGDKRLVGYVVSRERANPSVTELRESLKRELPDHMVPSAFVFLDALPLTPNGKVDHRALPAPEQVRPNLESAFAPPRSPVEVTVAGIWCQVLGLEKVGIHDNFFELGGHSLLATLVLARLRAAFSTRLPLRTLFEKPTVAELSAALQAGEGAAGPPRPAPIVPVSRRAISNAASRSDGSADK